MLFLGIELTNRCDIACLHCLRDKVDSRKDLEFELVQRIISEGRKMGTTLVSFTGGEPTLHPEYLHILDYVVSEGLPWNTISNGHNAELIKEVFSDPKRKSSNHLFALSLDGATEETHDHIRGKGSYKKVIRTATLLRHLGVHLRLQMVLTATNAKEIDDMAMLAATLGASSVYFIQMQPTEKSVASGMVMSPEAYRRALFYESAN